MNELLHSKRFRANLYKWLCMYVGVMLLLTTVITYSRYMTKLQISDDVRTAKFDVKVKGIEQMCPGTSSTCNSGAYLVGNQMNYYFTVDPKELEVRAEVSRLIIQIKNNFRIQKIENVKISTNVDGVPIEEITKTICDSTTSNTCLGTESKATGTYTYSLKEPVLLDLSNKEAINYKITLLYVGDAITNPEGIYIDKMITVDYTVQQKTK